ncbi:hypothetical protein B0H19DRAFT_1072258 [Mycena capillaripes]|nr:hypothetical protein B0H19DRAFT_1072258 [Mycena capillaripes]
MDLVSLRRLYMSHPEVMNCVKTPRLGEIAICFVHNEARALPAQLTSLFLRSSCPIRSLCLSGIPVIHATSEILNNIPSIVEPTVLGIKPAYREELTALILHLTVADSASIIAPHLQSIAFGYRTESTIDYTLYLAMVKSRWKAQECVLRCTMLLGGFGSSGPDPATIQGLDLLRWDELDLVWLNGKKSSDAKLSKTFNSSAKQRWCGAMVIGHKYSLVLSYVLKES